MYELSVAYRIYPKLGSNACVPPGWGKEAFAARCLDSFVGAVADIDYHLTAILDNCPETYAAMFADRIPESRLELVRLKHPDGGNNATFQRQLDLLYGKADTAFVALAEDDYLYEPGAYRAMMRFLQDGEPDFVCGYDHPDYYLNKPEPGKQDFQVGLHDYPSKIRWHGDRHWRTVSSTTCSFVTTPDTLRQAVSAFRLYPHIGDYGMWLALTHVRRTHAKWRETVRMYVTMPPRRMFGKAYTLYSPMPALACHMVSGYLSPGRDWRRELR